MLKLPSWMDLKEQWEARATTTMFECVLIVARQQRPSLSKHISCTLRFSESLSASDLGFSSAVETSVSIDGLFGFFPFLCLSMKL